MATQRANRHLSEDVRCHRPPGEWTQKPQSHAPIREAEEKNSDSTQCWWGPRQAGSLTRGNVTAVAQRGHLVAGSTRPQCGPGAAVLGTRPRKTKPARERSQHLKPCRQPSRPSTGDRCSRPALRPPCHRAQQSEDPGSGPCADLLSPQRTVLRRHRPPKVWLHLHHLPKTRYRNGDSGYRLSG